MHYEHIQKGVFISRPNRFIATVKLGKVTVTCHVKNTGRCKELLLPGTEVLLQHHPDAKAMGRKTEYSLIGVYKNAPYVPEGRLLINMDSGAPNQAAFEWLSSQSFAKDVRREVTAGNSRFDLAFRQAVSNPSVSKQAYMEVKGVTLEKNGIARFPDAPTLRGLKHVKELTAMAKEGIPCYRLFVIQMKHVSYFEPNMETHPEFGIALLEAQESGVHILAYDCLVTENSMTIEEPVPVRLHTIE